MKKKPGDTPSATLKRIIVPCSVNADPVVNCHFNEKHSNYETPTLTILY